MFDSIAANNKSSFILSGKFWLFLSFFFERKKLTDFFGFVLFLHFWLEKHHSVGPNSMRSCFVHFGRWSLILVIFFFFLFSFFRFSSVASRHLNIVCSKFSLKMNEKMWLQLEKGGEKHTVQCTLFTMDGSWICICGNCGSKMVKSNSMCLFVLTSSSHCFPRSQIHLLYVFRSK